MLGEELNRSLEKLGKGLGAKGQLGQRPSISDHSGLAQEAVGSLCVCLCACWGQMWKHKGDCEVGGVIGGAR